MTKALSRVPHSTEWCLLLHMWGFWEKVPWIIPRLLFFFFFPAVEISCSRTLTSIYVMYAYCTEAHRLTLWQALLPLTGKVSRTATRGPWCWWRFLHGLHDLFHLRRCLFCTSCSCSCCGGLQQSGLCDRLHVFWLAFVLKKTKGGGVRILML